MILLIVYVLIALVFSFLCSIAEAVILSVTSSHIAVLESEQRPVAGLLRQLKNNINPPLTASRTLNTIAHPFGAAGAGAQAAVVFGNAYLGVASAVLTFLILVFSEIIPKTLGANYWRELAPATAYWLRGLVWLLWPLVKLFELMTRLFSRDEPLSAVSRSEIAAMAELGAQEGHLDDSEYHIMKNFLALRDMRVREVMTPRTVVFSVPGALTVAEFFTQHTGVRFSRIPIYGEDQEDVQGFVLLTDLLHARLGDEADQPLSHYLRPLHVVPEIASLSQCFHELFQSRSQIMSVVDEYGGIQGVITQEDIVETILGLEIVDEHDRIADMRKLARRLWRQRMAARGINPEEL